MVEKIAVPYFIDGKTIKFNPRLFAHFKYDIY